MRLLTTLDKWMWNVGSLWKFSVWLLCYFGDFYLRTKIKEHVLPLNQSEPILARPVFLHQKSSHMMMTMPFVGCLSSMCLESWMEMVYAPFSFWLAKLIFFKWNFHPIPHSSICGCGYFFYQFLLTSWTMWSTYLTPLVDSTILSWFTSLWWDEGPYLHFIAPAYLSPFRCPQQPTSSLGVWREAWLKVWPSKLQSYVGHWGPFDCGFGLGRESHWPCGLRNIWRSFSN